MLDVKATRWHEDFNQFKTAVKDLEVMLQNVINSTFDHIGSVIEGVHELESFHSLARRESIVRCVEKKSACVRGSSSSSAEPGRVAKQKAKR